MENKPNNPNAFPLEYEEYNSVGLLCKRQDFGMTLRDYFAAKALNGICANSLANYGMISNNAEPAFIAQRCYQIADAMLNQREK